jgi:hypothetical protein
MLYLGLVVGVVLGCFTTAILLVLSREYVKGKESRKAQHEISKNIDDTRRKELFYSAIAS